MTARAHLLWATGCAMCMAAGVGTLLDEIMPSWAAACLGSVIGLALGAVAASVTPPRRSRRTKHRRGQ